MEAVAVAQWEANKEAVREALKKAHPKDYKDLVETVVTAITDPQDYRPFSLDPERVHQIDRRMVTIQREHNFDPRNGTAHLKCNGIEALNRAVAYGEWRGLQRIELPEGEDIPERG